jgi:predicted ArsR family transcriptional regulator
LEALEAEGLIAVKEQRPTPMAGRGRPSKVFRITDVGRDQFHQAYGELAAQAIAQLLEAAGPQGLGKLAKTYFRPIETGFAAVRASFPATLPLDALASALAASGYAAEASQLSGGGQLCQHHCPVADVARLYPELCEVETEMISSLLHSHVQRLATIAHGDGVCTTNIPAPAGSSRKEPV